MTLGSSAQFTHSDNMTKSMESSAIKVYDCEIQTSLWFLRINTKNFVSKTTFKSLFVATFKCHNEVSINSTGFDISTVNHCLKGEVI